MARLRERPQLPDHEVDQRLAGIVQHEGTVVKEPVREIPEREPRVEKEVRPPIRWMQWLAGFIVLIVAGGVVVFAVLRDSGTETASTYVGDPYAELSVIQQAVADFGAQAYVADAYAELSVIQQAVADVGAQAYVADAYAELGVIQQAVADVGTQSYVADATAELSVIQQAVADFEAQSYVADATAELGAIQQAVADYEAR